MADIRYVLEGYVADSYVAITFDVSATLSASATVTATGGTTQPASANLICNQSGLTWAEMGTWQEPKQEYWQDNFIVEGEVVIGGTINATANSTFTASALITARPVIEFTGVLQSTVTVNLIGSGIILPLGSAQLTADADLIGRSTANLQTQSTLTADPDLNSEGITLQLGSGSLTAQAEITARSPASITGVATTDTVGRGILRTSASFQPQCTVSCDGIIAISGRTVMQFSSSLGVVNEGIFITRRSPVNITAQASWNIVAGILAEGEANLGGVTSTLVVGSQFAIDPYRVYPVLSETRINILEQETRSHLVPSETRSYQIQHLTLVDEPGILDRRT